MPQSGKLDFTGIPAAAPQPQADFSGIDQRKPVSAEDFQAPAQPPDLRGPLRRFVSGAGEVLNPLTALESLFHLATSPVQTVTDMADRQMAQGTIARERFGEGRYLEGAGHILAGAVPILGPMAAEAGQQIASGDVAGGLGKGAGLALPAAAPAMARKASAAAPEGLRTRAATALETGASERVADVMSPKVGQNKVRFGNQAERVAPQIARDMTVDGASWSREGLHAQVEGRLAQAERALDEASNARLSARTFDTKPIIDGLLEKRRRLTAESVDASAFPSKTKSTRISAAQEKAGFGPAEYVDDAPLGESVIPNPNVAQVAMIDQAISELQQLGPAARYESIRRIREAYDGPAKTMYVPSMTQDYLKAQGGKMGAADVTGVLREQLAKWDPETAKANADYHVYRTANDVLEATREIERTRPRMGRAIMARMTGSIVGGQAAGAPGAIAGYVAGPVLDSALASGATTKLKTAKLMQQLAQAIRGGDEATAGRLIDTLKRVGAQGAALATSPNEPQRAPAPALAGAQSP